MCVELEGAATKTGEGIKYGSYSVIAISIGLQFALGSVLDYMINLLYFLQIISFIPLMDLNLPPFLTQFIGGYLKFANLQFDFIPNPFIPLFHILDNDPLNSQFASNGYQSKSLFLTYGQQLIYMIAYLLCWPLAIILNCITKNKYAFLRKWKQSYKYNGMIGFFAYSYIFCSFVTFLSLHHFVINYEHWQYYISLSISVIFLVIPIVLFIISRL